LTSPTQTFGLSLALSACGSTLAVGAPFDSDAAGLVYLYSHDVGAWSEVARLSAFNVGAGDLFGWSVALSGDGGTLAVGAINEASAATGVGGDQASDAAPGAGAVYVFALSAGVWIPQAYVKASNTTGSDQFGASVALSGDGSTLAVGARFEGSASVGVGGEQASNTAPGAGAVYVFGRGDGWSQQAYVKSSNTETGDGFGTSVALSTDGATLVVGARFEDSGARGLSGDQTSNAAASAGAVYTFTRGDGGWTQRSYLKALNTDPGDEFGTCVALSGDGATLAMSAPLEASAATGVGGNSADNSAAGAGAIYVLQ
jgi:hypothetical protein